METCHLDKIQAYLDNNFVIDCATNQPKWRAKALDARQAGLVNLVMSPWSIYEIGKASKEKMNEVIRIVDELEPQWILERVDLQLLEFLHAWTEFWTGIRTKFDPIGTLAEVQAYFLRVDQERVKSYTLRDYAEVWQRRDAHREARVEFQRQANISAWNRRAYSRGKMASQTVRDIRMRYVARQIVMSKGRRLSQEQMAKQEERILKSQKIWTFIRFFVEFGGLEDMKAHRVEEALTFSLWSTEAALNAHRLIDRFHATAALPYCEMFVTSDKELVKRSNRVLDELNFKIAQVLTGEDFIRHLDKLLLGKCQPS